VREVLVPLILPWIEKRDNLSGWRINATEIRPFVKIAAMAGQRQIARRIRVWRSVLLRDDMLNVEFGFVGVLRQPAVLTSFACTPPHKVANGGVNHGDGARLGPST